MSSRRIFISSIGYGAIKSNEVEPGNGAFAVEFKAIRGAMVIVLNCTIIPCARTRKFTPGIGGGRVEAQAITHVKQMPVQSDSGGNSSSMIVLIHSGRG